MWMYTLLLGLLLFYIVHSVVGISNLDKVNADYVVILCMIYYLYHSGDTFWNFGAIDRYRYHSIMNENRSSLTQQLRFALSLTPCYTGNAIHFFFLHFFLHCLLSLDGYEHVNVLYYDKTNVIFIVYC